MAYAQTSYAQKQGINGKYTIHDIGCFLTSFCNLLTLRYGNKIAPPDLNIYFINHGTYIDVDDGIRDDLGWSSIAAYDGSMVVTRVVDHGTAHTAGLPATVNAIVKFRYTSKTTGKITSHFCLYDGGGYIIDSWDGVRKPITSTSYGQPVAFAEYGKTAPQPVTPRIEGDEMIQTTADAQAVYHMLRPNGAASDAEIAGTAGKRTYKQFVADAIAEIQQRDANIAAQAAKLADAQALVTQLQTTIQSLNGQSANDKTQTQAALQKIASLTTQLDAANAQLGSLQKSSSSNSPAPASQTIPQAEPDVQKPGLVVRIIAALLRRKSD